jgi:peptide-methionine (R)-S-oxide reductase
MQRRTFLARFLGGAATSVAAGRVLAAPSVAELQRNWRELLSPGTTVAESTEPLTRSDEEWQSVLEPAQYRVLREEETERPFTSPLNDEHRPGVYVCVACDLPLFTSAMKFDSGTGWPSFFTTIPDAFATKRDFVLLWPRTEYHCVRCGGHHGHVFDDGPPPTGQRWCNNGVALRFIPSMAGALAPDTL